MFLEKCVDIAAKLGRSLGALLHQRKVTQQICVHTNAAAAGFAEWHNFSQREEPINSEISLGNVSNKNMQGLEHFTS